MVSAYPSNAEDRGKRVNVGNPGSGTRATVDVLFEAIRTGREHNEAE